jgi:hypothetical protein
MGQTSAKEFLPPSLDYKVGVITITPYFKVETIKKQTPQCQGDPAEKQ